MTRDTRLETRDMLHVCDARHALRRDNTDHARARSRSRHLSEGGMIRLETLIEPKFINSSFSSLSSWN